MNRRRLFRRTEAPLAEQELQGPRLIPGIRRSRFFAPGGIALQRYTTAAAFAEGSPEAELCRDVDRRLHKVQYLWDGVHEMVEVMAPADPDMHNLMDTFMAISTSVTGGPDLLVEIEIAIEATYYNAWIVRQATRKLPGVRPLDVPKLQFVRNQLLEHPDYERVYARTGVGLSSGISPGIGAAARDDDDAERFKGFSYEETLTEFRDGLAESLEAAAGEVAAQGR